MLEGIDGYGTKLEALMDPDARYDRLRQAFMQPGKRRGSHCCG